MRETSGDDVVRSFYRMRKTLGLLGFLLPLTLVAGGILSLGAVEPSISDYYHTLLRDVFVGTLTAIAMFLICYRGYGRGADERVSDDTITSVAGFAALGVAFLPNAAGGPSAPPLSVSQTVLGPQTAAIGHYFSAIIFLSCLGFLSLVKFSRTGSPPRRRLFRRCGWVIAAMTVATIVASWFKVMGPAAPQAFVDRYVLVLWFEAVAVWAFALSWLVKGRAEQNLSRILGKNRAPVASGRP